MRVRWWWLPNRAHKNQPSSFLPLSPFKTEASHLSYMLIFVPYIYVYMNVLYMVYARFFPLLFLLLQLLVLLVVFSILHSLSLSLKYFTQTPYICTHTHTVWTWKRWKSFTSCCFLAFSYSYEKNNYKSISGTTHTRRQKLASLFLSLL